MTQIIDLSVCVCIRLDKAQKKNQKNPNKQNKQSKKKHQKTHHHTAGKELFLTSLELLINSANTELRTEQMIY